VTVPASSSDLPIVNAAHSDASRADAAQPTPEVSARSARVVALVVGAVMLALLVLMIWGIGRAAQGTVGEVRLSTRPAPAFSIPLMDGKPFDLASTQGKPVLINFWASWCIPCEDEAATLEKLSREYRDRVAFIGVNVQDTDGNARDFLRRFGVTYPNGRDLSGAVAVDYGMSGVPESYFVDRSGRLVKKWQGPLDDARLRAYLDELLR
jgi:cytochrome c biogenesis protein CcmG/thiol:disulfide interchange protein DsbE